ncbi:MAG: hypothetical protein NTV06_06160 [candidate division Zixibacteria bacterium]|nr:hypothetical protein [candidate division Zixibacteria bacterium]
MTGNMLSKWLKIMALLSLCLILVAPVAIMAKVQLPQEKEVKVKFDSNMKISSGNLTQGIPLLIHLAESIEIGGIVIVEKDAVGTAIVSEIEKAGHGGKPGRIKVEFTELETKGRFFSPEGDKIKLGGIVENKGHGKKILSYLFIAGLFIKGGQGQINVDSVYTATIKEPILLDKK